MKTCLNKQTNKQKWFGIHTNLPFIKDDNKFVSYWDRYVYLFLSKDSASMNKDQLSHVHQGRRPWWKKCLSHLTLNCRWKVYCRIHSHLYSLKHTSLGGTILAKFLYLEVSDLSLLCSKEHVLPLENFLLTKAERMSFLFSSENYQVRPQSVEDINSISICLSEMENLLKIRKELLFIWSVYEWAS